MFCTSAPSSETRKWEELTPAERQAATLLGYHQMNWDNNIFSTWSINHEDKDWHELHSNERDALTATLRMDAR